MKRLFIDLELCDKCEECKITCAYLYHPQNNGITSLREYATFATICRQCTEAPCVNSCYRNALQKEEDGLLKRYSLRCTSCKSCTIACPFGVIFPELIPYINSRCDYCLGLPKQKIPACVSSCPYRAVELKEIAEDKERNIFLIGAHLAVHSLKWAKLDHLLKR